MPVAGRSYALRPRHKRGFIVIVGGDTTAPIVTFISQTRTKISRISGGGFDATDVVFSVNEDYQGYQVRRVSSGADTIAMGTLVESGTGGLSGVERTITLTDDEIIDNGGAPEGNSIYKIFAQDLSGNWSE